MLSLKLFHPIAFLTILVVACSNDGGSNGDPTDTTDSSTTETTDTETTDTVTTDTETTDTVATDTENTDTETIDTETIDTSTDVNTDPGVWERHVINDAIGESIMFKFAPDLCGDGSLKALGANHTNTNDNANAPESQLVLFDVPETIEELRKPWPVTKISEGIVSRTSPLGSPQGAPGVFGWGDVDMDGDLDILVSGDGDPHIYVIEQTKPCTFETRILASGMGQAGAMLIVDTDKDGVNELVVSSYEANVVRIYEWNKPKTIDYDTYSNNFDMHILGKRNAPAFATAGDVNDDGHIDLIVSHYPTILDVNMAGELVLYKGSSDLENWTPVVLDNGVKFPHVTDLIDIDRDGDLDMFHPSGFLACESNPLSGGACGAIQWYENNGTDDWPKHQIFGPKSIRFFWKGVFDDFDNDGLADFITIGERKPSFGAQSARVMLFKGIGSDPYFSSEPVEIMEGLGTIPEGRDIDNDGDMDIFSAEYFLPKGKFPAFSFAWMEQITPPSAD